MERVTKVKNVTKPKDNGPARNYCFTTFLGQEEEVMIMKGLKDLKYMIYGIEVCPKTAQVHFQGYLELKKPMRIAALKKLGVKTTHFEKRRGSQEQAITYCKKDGKFQETGTLTTEQGKRSDLSAIKGLLDEGKPLAEVAQMKEHFGTFLKYQRGLKEYETIVQKPRRTEVPEVWVYHGEPGSGKTTKALDDIGHDDPTVLTEPTNKTVWWPKDKTTEYVIIEEFEGWIPWNTFKVWLDKTNVDVEYKGGTKPLLARRFIITSNKHPSEWFPQEGHQKALVRRITKCLKFTEGTFGENFTETKLSVTKAGGVTEVPL